MSGLPVNEEMAMPGIDIEPSDSLDPKVMRLPELLAPAGDWDCAKAAVENGADAIYFGLEKFNARMRARNFTESDLPALIEFLRRRGVKGYVTFNTLVFENEMAEAEQYARAIIAAGVDAAIVQDVGICRLIRRLSPDFPIHVSTQMTITSAGGIEFARELGCNLVVLARECTLKEIEKILAPKSTPSRDEVASGGAAASNASLPLEVFVHGALCVAYSGQCLTSEALGGRSANRGECAQACRMPYDLIADGQQVALGDRKYLLSPQDLAGLEIVHDLARLGIASLKIEGRLKSPEYVANITRIYRQALDRLSQPAKGTDRTHCTTSHIAKKRAQYEMEMAFSRGLYTGWFRGINNQELVHGNFGKKRGVYLGKVLEVLPEAARVRLDHSLEPGEGIVFDGGHPEEKEEGGRVYEVINEDSRAPKHAQASLSAERTFFSTIALLRFGHGDINFKRVRVGDKVWKTSDPKLEKELRRTYEGDQVKFRRPISMEVHGGSGQFLTLVARDELGHVVRCDSSVPLSKADVHPLTTERLREQLGRLGGTPFFLSDLESQLPADVMLPVSELNRLRRQAVNELESLRARPQRWTVSAAPAESGAEFARSEVTAAPHLIVLVRNLSQLDAALESNVPTLYCDFEDPKKYREAVSRFRARPGREANSAIFVAPPRIFKMGEEWTLRQVRSSDADGYLVRNYDHLRFFENDRKIGDYSLNIANRLSADYFKNKFRLERITASYDLNFAQLEALLRAAPPEWFEITVHQHMPMFHMEHCLFCAFLTKGTDYSNCGRPCDTREVRLRDRVGAEHPIKADVGCRNTVFNARAQTGAEYAARMLDLGVRSFRIEFVDESAETVERTIRKYRQLLAGEINGAQLWRELKLINQLGVTRGQMAGAKEV
jgi:U32 family peptidase